MAGSSHPEDLGMLEGPDRDAWQQPERVMDALAIADGATVADLGAGGGWFTVRPRPAAWVRTASSTQKTSNPR